MNLGGYGSGTWGSLHQCDGVRPVVPPGVQLGDHMGPPSYVHLVEPTFCCERDTDLAYTRPDPLIRAVEYLVAVEATVQHRRQFRRQAVTNSESATAKRHAIRVHDILFNALRVGPNVVHLTVIVLR